MIFKLIPAAKDYIWGGTRLKEEWGKHFDLDPLAETWECSTHPDGPSMVANGEYEGKTLKEAINGDIPILIKFIDAKSDLSVQVHPDDGYANLHEGGQRGKTEMWYVVDAQPGASLVFGLSHDMTKDELRERIEEGKLERYLNHIPVRKNDVFFIPAGTIHAIGKGVVIAEIQESSNLTYRLYDYGRLGKDGKPRQLHIDKAIEVSNLKAGQNPRQPMRILRYTPGCAREVLCSCQYFQVERWIVNSADGVVLNALPESFRNVLCLRGEGRVGNQEFRKGDSLYVSPTNEDLQVFGNLEFLITRI